MEGFKPYSGQIGKKDICDKAEEALRSLRVTDGIIRRQVFAILNELPGEVKSLIMISKRCCRLADAAIEGLAPTNQKEFLENIRQTIKREIVFLLYESYLKEVTEWLKDYCKQHKVPKQWGLGSIEYWTGEGSELWGKSFYMFWRYNIESEGDSAFQERILPHMPQAWQDNYEMLIQIPCPYKWETMKDKEIAQILEQLQKKSDPKTNQWGLGSIQYWTGEGSEPWGMSFYHFWRRNIELEGDSVFQERILPHMPQAWQDNYEMRQQNRMRTLC